MPGFRIPTTSQTLEIPRWRYHTSPWPRFPPEPEMSNSKTRVQVQGLPGCFNRLVKTPREVVHPLHALNGIHRKWIQCKCGLGLVKTLLVSTQIIQQLRNTTDERLDSSG